MKALHFHGPKTPLELVNVPEPEPGPGEVLVDVKAVGLCHTDVGYLEGHFDLFTDQKPFILGHEVAGVVSKVGAEVSGVAVGDRVALHSLTSLSGIARDGGYAQKTVSVAEGLVPIPDDVGFDQAAVATDAGQTSYNAVARTAAVSQDMKVGIIGLGGLGFVGAQIAVHLGAEVVAAEPDESLHDPAKELGVNRVVRDAQQFPSDLDRVIDFAGFETTAPAMAALKEHGMIVQVGVGNPEATVPLGELIAKSITLRGIMGGTKGDIADVLNLISEGTVSSRIEEIRLEDIPAGLQRLKEGGVGARLVALM